MKMLYKGVLLGSIVVILHQIFISRQGYDTLEEGITIVGIRIFLGAIVGGLGFLIIDKNKKAIKDD